MATVPSWGDNDVILLDGDDPKPLSSRQHDRIIDVLMANNKDLLQPQMTTWSFMTWFLMTM